MKRLLYTCFLILLISSCVIIFLQWNVYSQDKKALAEKATQDVRQRLQINQGGRGLTIRHTITHVNKGEYRITNPQNVDLYMNGQQLADPSLYIQKDDQTVTFSYSLPFDSAIKEKLLINWAIKMEGLDVKSTTVEITSHSPFKGVWAAGAAQTGRAEKEYIDYFVFEKKGGTFPLYYQQGDLSVKKLANGLYLYYEKGIEADWDLVSSIFTRFPDLKDKGIVVTSMHPEYFSDSIFFLKNINNSASLQKKINQANLDLLYPFKASNESWQQGVLEALAKGDDSPSSLKSIKMAANLREALSEDDISLFLRLVRAASKPLSADQLDQLLSSLTGDDTIFFRSNRNGQLPLEPLYHSDERLLEVNGAELGNRMIVCRSEELYPLAAVMEAAGYQTIEMNAKTIFVIKKMDSLRLYADKNIFVLNGKDYAISGIPIIKVNGVTYIRKEYLKTIFGALINEGKDKITLSM
ncbi:stalk domain-containing protein [Bacillus testis]|uniref:stalk domain-containing protein n=1 Tax=Bacillus testis TaxID=1622072 RepID=UPI00067ED2EF|nr:stalk domain-containing protein [Bacillus testis]